MPFRTPRPRVKGGDVGRKRARIWDVLREIEDERHPYRAEEGDNTVPFSDPVAGFQCDDGKYFVKLLKLEDIPPTEDHPDWGPRMRWKFEVAELTGEVMDGELWQTTGQSIGPRSSARPWIQALLGRDIDKDDSGEFLTDAIIGKRAEAMIVKNEKGYCNILNLKPVKRKTEE